MVQDPTQRTLPNNRLLVNFINTCCSIPITWDTDLSMWEVTEEVWGITYFNMITIQTYIGS